ncbi:transmembrane protein, putative [Bodo saltans]|uniref:Transmembrane protein, putative n=1 Tax=Bodo saltans TaxID=75058 RepID=A0A0S4IJ15_BODSA|nr:transmembrane protein, putative [Bodo saltans]|eukprot:CUE74119.1 transmembrane protein, putative [Bodo saltans]
MLYVGGQTTAIRKIDLTTRNVTTIRLNIVINWPVFLQLTPSYDALFVSNYQTHTVLAIDTATDTLIRVVAGSTGAAGTSDGFGSNARFTYPEGIALVGVEYGWPCLYVYEEAPAYIREIRLRDQYVRTIPLVGLPVGYDIEGIVSYANRTSGEFGLLLMNRVGGIFFLPIGIVPPTTPSASSEQTSSTTTSIAHSSSQSATYSTHPTLHSATYSSSWTRARTLSQSHMTSSRSNCVTKSTSYSGPFSPTTTATSLTKTSSLSNFMTESNSYSGSFSTTTTPPCQLQALRRSVQLHCHSQKVYADASLTLCEWPSLSLSGLVLLAPLLTVLETRLLCLVGVLTSWRLRMTAPAQLLSAPVARATLLRLPAAPLLVTLVVNGSICWYVTNVTTSGFHTSMVSGSVAGSVETESQDDTFFSVVQLLVTPTAGGWLSGLTSGDLLYQSKSLVFNVTLRCSTDGDHGTLTRFVLITVPCPALPRTLTSEVTTGVVALQWISAVGGPGASGAMGRLTVVRSLALCSAAGGLSGLVTVDLPDCTEALAENSIGGLLGNILIIAAATFVLLVLCWLLAPPQSGANSIATLVAGARRTAFPSTLLPIATMLTPTTAGLVVVVLRDLADVTSPTAACQVTVTVSLVVLALCFCAVTLAVPIATHWVATSDLVLLESGESERREGRKQRSKFTVPCLTKRYRWRTLTGGAKDDDSPHHQFAVLLNEFRLLWYCVLDLVSLVTVGILAGVAQSSHNSAVCAGCGIVTCCVYAAQFVLCARTRPFLTTFGNAYAALTMLLSALSSGMQAAQLVMQSASSPVDVATLERLMLGSAVCDLCVMGITSLRLVLDLCELVAAVVRRVKERCSPDLGNAHLVVSSEAHKNSDAGGVERSSSSSASLVLPTACDAINSFQNTSEDEHLNTELVGLFWDTDGNALQDDAMVLEYDATDLIIAESRWGDDGSEKDLNTDLVGLFRDDEGNAEPQGDAECADGATNLMQVVVRK